MELSRRQFAQAILGAAAGLACARKSVFPQIVHGAGATLRDLAGQKGITYGCATTKQALSTDQEFAALVSEQCALLVPETEMKWKYLEPQQNHFVFDNADWMFDFAKRHGMQLRGHVLVWQEALPSWMNSITAANAKAVMTNHIRKVMEHYRGKLHSWDVVNEAIAFRNQGGELRESPFLRLIGPDYVEIAFRTAAETDPNALLVYNENHLEYDNADDQFRRDTLLKQLKQWTSRKVPIGALGLQSHLRTGNVPFSASKLSDFLQRVSDLGLKLIVSELDVAERGSESSVSDRDRAIEKTLDQYLNTVLKNNAVIAVVTWGLSARYTWISNYAPRPDGQPVRPLPYDRDLHPTSAWTALASAFEHAPKR